MTEEQRARKKEYNRIRYAQKREAIRAQQKQYYDKNADSIAEQKRQYYLENSEAIAQRKLDYNARNPDVVKARSKKYYEANKSAFYARAAARRAGLGKATPSWLNETQKAQITYVYSLAKEARMLSGDDHHVDHIVPLKGKDVCGLHVPWNLQVLSATENLTKGNRI